MEGSRVRILSLELLNLNHMVSLHFDDHVGSPHDEVDNQCDDEKKGQKSAKDQGICLGYAEEGLALLPLMEGLPVNYRSSVSPGNLCFLLGRWYFCDNVC